MKLLVFGCERHVFNLFERHMARQNPSAIIIDIPADGDLEAELLKHLPTHIVPGSDDLATFARETVSKLGIASIVLPFQPPEPR